MSDNATAANRVQAALDFAEAADAWMEQRVVCARANERADADPEHVPSQREAFVQGETLRILRHRLNITRSVYLMSKTQPDGAR